MADLKEKVFHCPLEVTTSLVGGKWQCVILWHLRQGKLRFNQLQKRLIGITPKMLTQQLRDLQDNGLISRKVYPIIPPKVEYTLTEYGESFLPILQAMYSWGENYSKSFHLFVDTYFQEQVIAEEKQQAEKPKKIMQKH